MGENSKRPACSRCRKQSSNLLNKNTVAVAVSLFCINIEFLLLLCPE